MPEAALWSSAATHRRVRRSPLRIGQALLLGFLALLLSVAASGCRANGTLAILFASESIAGATASLTVSIARPGGESDANALCAAPDEADFDETSTFPFPLADAAFPDLRQGWYAVWVRAYDATDLLLAEACEVSRVGFFNRTVEVTLAGDGPDGGLDAGPDAATDGGVDAMPPPMPVCVRVVTAGVTADPVPTTVVHVVDAAGDSEIGITDPSGETCLLLGAIEPVDVTVRRFTTGDVDSQLTVTGLADLSDFLEIPLPSPLAPLAPNPATVSGSVTGFPGGSATGEVTFINDPAFVSGNGPVNGAGDGYDVMMSDDTGLFSSLLLVSDMGMDSFVVGPAAPLSPAPAFDATTTVPMDVSVDGTVSGDEAMYDGVRGFAASLILERGERSFAGAALPMGMPATLTVFDPIVDAPLALEASLGTSALVAMCGNVPEMVALGRRVLASGPVGAAVDFPVLAAPTDVVPLASDGTYAGFAIGSPIEWSNGVAPTAMVVSLSFVRPSGETARVEMVLDGGDTSAVFPNPLPDADLLEADAAGFCLTLARVDSPDGYAAVATRAASVARMVGTRDADVSVAARTLYFVVP